MKLTKIRQHLWILVHQCRGVCVQRQIHPAHRQRHNNQDARLYASILGQAELNIKYIINTHEHHDHWGGNHYLRNNTPAVFMPGANRPFHREQLPLFRCTSTAAIRPILVGVGGTGQPTSIIASNPEPCASMMKSSISSPARSFPGQTGIATREGCASGGTCSARKLDKYGFPFCWMGPTIQTMNRILDLPTTYLCWGMPKGSIPPIRSGFG